MQTRLNSHGHVSRRQRVATIVVLSTLLVIAPALPLVHAKPKDTRGPKEKICDNEYIACGIRCNHALDPKLCNQICDQNWNQCNGYANRPKPNVPAPSASVSPRPTLVPRTEKQNTKSSPSPTPKAAKTPTEKKKH